MFKKNPNQYFYRHNEPGEEQWLHDWSAQEQELFLEIVRQHGCGDKVNYEKHMCTIVLKCLVHSGGCLLPISRTGKTINPFTLTLFNPIRYSAA